MKQMIRALGAPLALLVVTLGVILWSYFGRIYDHGGWHVIDQQHRLAEEWYTNPAGKFCGIVSGQRVITPDSDLTTWAAHTITAHGYSGTSMMTVTAESPDRAQSEAQVEYSDGCH